MVCHTKSCTLSIIFNVFLVVLLAWIALIRQNTLLYSPAFQTGAGILSTHRPIIAVYLIVPSKVFLQHAHCQPYAILMTTQEPSIALQTAATVLGKNQFFCTLKN